MPGIHFIKLILAKGLFPSRCACISSVFITENPLLINSLLPENTTLSVS